MKYLITAFALAFVVGCGDKDEDTGADTAEAVDTSDTAAE